MDSLHFTSLSLSLHNHSLRSLSFQEVEVVGERWLLQSQSKKVLKKNTARARLARVWIQLQFFKEILLKMNRKIQKRSGSVAPVSSDERKNERTNIPLFFCLSLKQSHSCLVAKICLLKFLVGFKFWSSRGVAPLIFKITIPRRLFSKMVPNFTVLLTYFWGLISWLIFFFWFQINLKWFHI